MKTKMATSNYVSLLLGMLFLGLNHIATAQTPQDNWYLEQTWVKTNATLNATNGGLSLPYGVAIGPDGRVYVGDEGYGRIQVYLPDGTFSFSITNGFGGGLKFSKPRGMITDKTGNLYVADYGTNCVYEFTANGVYLRKFGSGTGSGNGQLSGVIDVAVSPAGLVYVLENANCRVSVFNADGSFLKTLLASGPLDSQLQSPASIAIMDEGKIYISQNYMAQQSLDDWNGDLNRVGALPTFYAVKIFDTSGFFLSKFSQTNTTQIQDYYAHYWNRYYLYLGPCSIRFDRAGLLYVILSMSATTDQTPDWDFVLDTSVKCNICTAEGSVLATYSMPFNSFYTGLYWPCQGIGGDGRMVVCGNFGRPLGTRLNSRNLSTSIQVSLYALREQWSPPRNTIPVPNVVNKQQRSSSPLVDIDYVVVDADDTNVIVGVLVFTSSNTVPSLANCIRNPTWIENTATNLGPAIAANQVHRLTWNAGADWSTNLGNYRVAILAQDHRTNLLDIHYLQLPAGNGMPALKVSRSPLNTNDFMQVWWWQLATGDPGIMLSSNQIFGVSGAFLNKQLCTNGLTTADGRSYIYAKMNVREATLQEVQWAKQGNMPAGSSPNQWPPARQVGGRPKAVNEYGFDTGGWDTNTCKWVVPLN